MQGICEFDEECFKKYGKIWGWVFWKLPLDTLIIISHSPSPLGMEGPQSRASWNEVICCKALETYLTRDPRGLQVCRSIVWIRPGESQVITFLQTLTPRDSSHRFLSVSHSFPPFPFYLSLGGLKLLHKMHYSKTF